MVRRWISINGNHVFKQVYGVLIKWTFPICNLNPGPEPDMQIFGPRYRLSVAHFCGRPGFKRGKSRRKVFLFFPSTASEVALLAWPGLIRYPENVPRWRLWIFLNISYLDRHVHLNGVRWILSSKVTTRTITVKNNLIKNIQIYLTF